MNRIKKLTRSIVKHIAKCCDGTPESAHIMKTIRNVNIRGKFTNIHIASLGTIHPKSGVRRILLIYIDGFGGKIYLPLNKYVCDEAASLAVVNKTTLTRKKNRLCLNFEHRVDNLDPSKIKYSSKRGCSLFEDSSRERIPAKEIKDRHTPKSGNSYILSYEFAIQDIINMAHPNLFVYDTNTLGFGGEVRLICLDGNGRSDSIITDDFLDGLANESDYRKLRSIVDASLTPEHVTSSTLRNELAETRRRFDRAA